MLRVHDVGPHRDALAIELALEARDPCLTRATSRSRSRACACSPATARSPRSSASGQRFVIDVARRAAPRRRLRHDDVADAVDYGALAARVVEVASGGPYALLERLADAIAVALLDGFPVGEVSVRVAKPGAPVPRSSTPRPSPSPDAAA